jgi:organic radical activating enzyme
MKKTLRLIITLDCNLKCEYCCNKIPEVNSKFIKKKLEDIAFEQYEDICISGGEPLLQYKLIHNIYILNIPISTPIYLYTNGLLLNSTKASFFNGVNIGIHYKEQLKQILENNPNLLSYKGLRLCVQDIYKDEYLPNIPDKYIKTWSMNDCFNNVETEDWILLEK